MPDIRPLRSATFRHLATAYWVNEFGNWIGEIALTILVYDRTGSPLATAALFLSLRFLPAVLAPLLTARVEVMRPHVVLGTLYVLEGVLFGAIAVLTHHFSLPAVFVLGAFDGMLAVTAKALTRSATASGLLADGLLREGNAILNLGMMAAMACSPVIAGVLVAWKGAAAALFVDAATFIVTAAVVVTAPNIHVETDTEAGFVGRLRNGASVLRNRTAVRRLMIAIAFVMMLSNVPIPIEIVFAKHVLHVGASGYGLLLGAWGAGMVVGAAAFAAAGQMRLITVVAMGTLLCALGYGGLAVSPTLAVACGCSAVGGLGNGAGWIAAVTAVQERIPINTQSAVMAVLEGLNQVMPAIGFAVGGAIAAVASPRYAYGVAAVGVAAVVLFAAFRPIDHVQLGQVDTQDAEESVEAVDFQGDLASDAQETDTSDRRLPSPNLITG
ncbi:MAG TPA: MFS transporter [Solirubrobacteraceae bacterium]|jgi:MFS family permease|nr:MFS transporter [Solirubrobacteraceae bacterium]